jgi:hypothetical protein
MAELRITQFYAANIASLAYIDVYTVPVGRRIIVKSVQLRNQYTGSNGVWIALGTTALYYVSLPGNGSLEIRPWWVITEGQTLKIKVGNAAGVGVLISGASHYI